MEAPGNQGVPLRRRRELIRAARVEAHHIGEQDTVGTAVRDMEVSTERMRHTVIQPESGVGERDAGHAGSVMHLLSCLQILRIPVHGQKVLTDQRQRFLRHRVGEVVVLL